MDRETRRLVHNKGNKMKIVTSPPEPREGSDGDMCLQTAGIGAVLYVKGQGRWWKFQPNEATGDGWHGSTRKVKIVGSDFVAGVDTTKGELVSAGLAGYMGVDNGSALNQLNAVISIPIGYIPTAMRIYNFTTGTTDNPGIAVYEQNMTVAGAGTLLTSTPNWDEEFALKGASKSSDTSYLRLIITSFHGGSEATTKHYIRGGYVKIAPVVTIKEITSRATEEDVLGRQS